MYLVYSAALSLIITIGVVWGTIFYVPLDIIENEAEPSFGATITTIAGSDTLSSSRTTINNNFANLNADKLELSTFYSTTTHSQITTLGSLSTVGTIISGIWNGTAIGVAYGGTGTTSPTSNLVMLGNGSSGLKVVNGFGTSGQFLTSNGAATAPTWQSSTVDQNAQYNWTAHHIFSSLRATSASTTNATSTNAFNFAFLASKLLKVDAEGDVMGAVAGTDYATRQWQLADPGQVSGANGYATSTTLTIPAGTLSGSTTIKVMMAVTCATTTNPGTCKFFLRDGTGANLASTGTDISPAAITVAGELFMHAFANNSTTAQNGFAWGTLHPTTFNDGEQVNEEQTSSVNFANALVLSAVAFGGDANTTATIHNVTIEVLP